MNINKMTNMMVNRKRKNRNTLLLSLLGVTVAGGATYLGMKKNKKGNGNENGNGLQIQNMLRNVTDKVNAQQILKTNPS